MDRSVSMATSSAEDYLKALYRLSDENREEGASTGQLARRLGLTPGSVTGMLQRLERAGLVEYAPASGGPTDPIWNRGSA